MIIQFKQRANAHQLAYLNATEVGQVTWDNIDGLWY